MHYFILFYLIAAFSIFCTNVTHNEFGGYFLLSSGSEMSEYISDKEDSDTDNSLKDV